MTQEAYDDLTEEPVDKLSGEQNSRFFVDDKPVEFLDQRFVEDEELRLSGEQRLKLEIIRSLREPCDRLAYGKKLREAAKKLGKSERTVRRLIKDWENAGLAVLEPRSELTRASRVRVNTGITSVSKLIKLVIGVAIA
jgi:putative transposase